MSPTSTSVASKGPPIEKKILHAGIRPNNDEEIKYQQGTKLQFHFTTHTTDGTLLDDSRKWDKPMEIIMGKKFKLEVWEVCLQAMAVKEVARFRVKKHLTFNYPTVAKTLRDAFDKAGGSKEPHQHMCGMMAMQMQGGLGHDDLNQLMKEPADLDFTLELLSVEQPDEYKKESWQMDAGEKMGEIPSLKEEGNRLYQEKKVDEAEEKYKTAIGMLEQLMLREKPHEAEWLDLRDKKVPLLLNFAQCKLSKKEYYPVIEHTTEVLETDPGNVKALFRRGKAHIGAWNPVDAKNDLEKVMDLDPSLTNACKKELIALENMEKEKDAQDRSRLKKLF